jgi:hypothetical protein
MISVHHTLTLPVDDTAQIISCGEWYENYIRSDSLIFFLSFSNRSDLPQFNLQIVRQGRLYGGSVLTFVVDKKDFYHNEQNRNPLFVITNILLRDIR